MDVDRHATDASDGPPAPAIVCDGATRRYGGGGGSLLSRGPARRTVTALEGVDLRVDRGEFVGIAGPSGSGKSTLLHLLAALDVPDAGRVAVDGTETAELSERGRTRLRRETIGIVFQRFHLLPALSARGNVAAALIDRGVSKADRRERALARLEAVGLGDRATHRPGQLSGGEQQRVAIARALVGDPAIVVADEPTGELDTDTGATVLELLAGVADERAVVMASHDDRALAATDRVVELRDGARVDG